ncbi:MAG: lipid-A-disaccharide synthase [Hyphomicrobiaceae bacterium]
MIRRKKDDGSGRAPEPLRLFIVAGEHSGDRLGGKLITELLRLSPLPIEFRGVGAEDMEAAGLDSLFAMSDVAVMGPLAILKRLPLIYRRVHETVDAAVRFRPHAVVIIDSPEFTHPIARRIRRRLPGVPVVDYVSPTVWAWRPGRARKMAAYVDEVLALLPFEPDAHRRLGGPACTYVGHPLVDRLPWIASLDTAALARRLALDPRLPVVTVLPGSRPTEVRRLMQPFGEALGLVAERKGGLQVVLPAVKSVMPLIEEGLKGWPVEPHIVMGETDKFTAFRLCDAALAASGTVTLELATAGTPMVVAYKVDALAARLRFLVKTPSIVLANLVLGRNVFPELIQEACTGETLAAALTPLLSDTPERRLQQEALGGIAELMAPPASSPSVAAAESVLRYALTGRG